MAMKKSSKKGHRGERVLMCRRGGKNFAYVAPFISKKELVKKEYRNKKDVEGKT